MSESVCVGCKGTWRGIRPEHCPACHITFSSTAAGDAHRTGSFDRNMRRCLPPEQIKLVCKDQGGPVWGFKSDPEAIERLRALKKSKDTTIISIDEILA